MKKYSTDKTTWTKNTKSGKKERTPEFMRELLFDLLDYQDALPKCVASSWVSNHSPMGISVTLFGVLSGEETNKTFYFYPSATDFIINDAINSMESFVELQEEEMFKSVSLAEMKLLKEQYDELAQSVICKLMLGEFDVINMQHNMCCLRVADGLDFVFSHNMNGLNLGCEQMDVGDDSNPIKLSLDKAQQHTLLSLLKPHWDAFVTDQIAKENN